MICIPLMHIKMDFCIKLMPILPFDNVSYFFIKLETFFFLHKVELKICCHNFKVTITIVIIQKTIIFIMCQTYEDSIVSFVFLFGGIILSQDNIKLLSRSIEMQIQCTSFLQVYIYVIFHTICKLNSYTCLNKASENLTVFFKFNTHPTMVVMLM